MKGLYYLTLQKQLVLWLEVQQVAIKALYRAAVSKVLMLSITYTLILTDNNFLQWFVFGGVFVTASFQCGQGARVSARQVLFECAR